MTVVREVRYRDEEYNVIIHLRQARVIEGMRRGQIIQERLGRETVKAVAEGGETPLTAPTPTLDTLTHRLVSFYTYPACIAATTAIDNLKSYTDTSGKEHPFTSDKELLADIPFEEFLELPEALVVMWEEAAYELNPHWGPQFNLRPKAKESEEPRAEGDTLPNSQERS